jgi:hypothetical protein
MALARATDPYPDPSWSGWGDPANVPELPEEVLSLLGHALGVSRPGRRPGPISAVTLPSSRLPAPVRTMLETAIGVANVVDRDEARVRHTRGKSTPAAGASIRSPPARPHCAHSRRMGLGPPCCGAPTKPRRR